METIKAEVVHQELYNMYLGYVAILIAEADSKKVAMSSEGEAIFEKLKTIGAINTPTYHKLYTLRTNTEETNKKISEIEGYYETWKYFKDKYPKSLIISFKDFISLSYKYDLFSDKMSCYCKDIPLDVLDNLSSVNSDLFKFLNNLDKYKYNRDHPSYRNISSDNKELIGSYLSENIKLGELNRRWSKVTRIDFYKGVKSSIINEAKDSFTRFPFIYSVYNLEPFISNDHISTDSVFRRIGINPRKVDVNSVSVNGEGLMISDMLISAPHDHFIENRNISINKLPYTYQERIKLEDPLVFQLLPFGVLIHDKWGEVANDKIFGGIQ